jgi:hypothetical protein
MRTMTTLWWGGAPGGWQQKQQRQKQLVVAGRVSVIPLIAECAMDGAPGHLLLIEEGGYWVVPVRKICSGWEAMTR